ncbi:ABC transporter permease [Periweissella ghanensis]|uniref:ABC-2 type transporter transmembrane domain-containing protein n=1 Tax=Periweissella ghanensis TaxID=467997 RepID=A0ABN8BQX0_9LACO|nr:ABC transporter permease [Periweissella ghanensis]MCM0600225.1 ABC transporter permease [Periweissella ghanensis]CAH0419143.1 hypothetical protein WGH24286_01590 [Periweissella ghanensis]
MIWMVRRNLQLYFSKFSNVLLSLLGAIISIVLYLVFLKGNLMSSWAALPNATTILDWWLIGGTMVITALTTTLNSLSVFVGDREQQTFKDLALTDVSPSKLLLGYLGASLIIGVLMQMVMFVILSIYFGLTDGLKMQWQQLPQVFGIAILSSLVWTAFNLLVTSFIKRTDNFGKVGTILATAAGFFVGVYVPFGILSKTANHIIQLTPAPYNSALYRQILLQQPLAAANLPSKTLLSLKKDLGVDIVWHVNATTAWQNGMILGIFTLIFTFSVMIFARKHLK